LKHGLTGSGVCLAEIAKHEVEAELIAFERDGEWWRCTRTHHLQRHHDGPTVHRALRAAGLRWWRVHGMHLDGSVTDGFDELANSKAVYIARESAPEAGEGR
jgi:hypothetical protein